MKEKANNYENKSERVEMMFIHKVISREIAERKKMTRTNIF